MKAVRNVLDSLPVEFGRRTLAGRMGAAVVLQRDYGLAKWRPRSTKSSNNSKSSGGTIRPESHLCRRALITVTILVLLRRPRENFNPGR